MIAIPDDDQMMAVEQNAQNELWKSCNDRSLAPVSFLNAVCAFLYFSFIFLDHKPSIKIAAPVNARGSVSSAESLLLHVPQK